MKYGDIINLPHHVSRTHPQMSMIDRAAQFSPFAALTGYGDAIDEAARHTQERIELDEDELLEIERRLREAYAIGVPVEITHFVPDDQKDGGAYIETSGLIKKLDPINQTVRMADGESIDIEDILTVSLQHLSHEPGVGRV